MRKVLTVVIMVGCVVAILTGCNKAMSTPTETIIAETENALKEYTKDATVTKRVGTEIIVCDADGEEWAFFVDTEDTLTINDKIILVMSNNGTDTIYDDEIIDYIYQE